MKKIGFVIITYNRAADCLALLQNLVSLQNYASLVEEVIIVNNASTTDYDTVMQFIHSLQLSSIKYLEAPSNLGVAKGRNFAIQQTTAPILVFLDDDAELEDNNVLQCIEQAFVAQNTSSERTLQRPVGIVSFKVLYYAMRTMQENAFPHKQFQAYKNLPHFPTYYFAGGAHAVLRSVLLELGSYPTDFFYGMEEYDLSYRALDAGYSIVYDHSIVMLHKESPLGRTTAVKKLQMMWINKAIVAYRYLPVQYFISTSFLWSLFFLKKTSYNIGGFFGGWMNILKIPFQQKRKPVSTATMAYLKQVKARLNY